MDLQDAGTEGSSELAFVPRQPLAGMRQNSLQLTDWTKGLTMPGRKRAAQKQQLQQKLVDVIVARAELPAGALVFCCLPCGSALRAPTARQSNTIFSCRHDHSTGCVSKPCGHARCVFASVDVLAPDAK